MITTEVWNWLEEQRGLDGNLCERMGLRPTVHRELGAGVALAYRKNGENYADKFRPIGQKTFRWHPKDAQHSLYNSDCLLDETLSGHPVIITEGEFDCISVIQAGFPRCVSVPDGWSTKADEADGAKMKPILEAEELMRKAPCIIVAADADVTGEAFIRAIAALFEDQIVVKAVRWPEDCKDANDVLCKYDVGEIVRAINSARTIELSGGPITGFSDLPPQSERRILRLGFEPFDWGLAFEEGAMSVCTGVPGMGKSTFVRFCAHHLARNERIKIGALELENSALQMRNHLAWLNRGRAWEDMSPAEKTDLNTTLDQNWRVAHRAPNGDIEENILWLKSRIRALAIRERCKFIYVDPWNELEHIPARGESVADYLNYATKNIRQWAERYDTHVCVIAHPKKLQRGHGVPDGYDVADGAAWANKPSLGFTVHQVEGDDPHVKVKTWKVRDVQRYGFERGIIKLDFDTRTMAYRRRAQASQQPARSDD